MQRALHDAATTVTIDSHVVIGEDSNLELANQSDVDVFLCAASGKEQEQEKTHP
jgi:hypothetical protein